MSRLTSRMRTRNAEVARVARLPWWERPIARMIPRSRYLRHIVEKMRSRSDVSTHSAQGTTLRFLVQELEASGTPYTLEAHPGRGYALTSHPERRDDAESAAETS